MRYVSSFFCPHCTGWFRRFLVANTYLPGRVKHAIVPSNAHAGLPYPRFYNGVMRPEPSPDSPADKHPGFSPASRPDENLREQLSRLVPKLPGDGSLPPQITHVHRIPAREGQYSPWPHWLHPRVVEAFESLGVHEPYTHQVQAAQAAHCAFDATLAEDAHRLSFGRASGQGQDESGTTARHVIVATGTASGKSLSYLMPAFDALYRGAHREPLSATAADTSSTGFHQRANVLYISPARALSADQLNAITAYHLPGLNAATYDGDTPAQERRWVREHANFVLTTPDMLNYGILGNHRQWANFLRGLRYVVLDEVHSYRGVFGAHIANLLRRLRRVCALYRVSPVFYGASATSANPAESFAKLIGVPEGNVDAITASTAPRGESTVILWEPEFLPDTQVTDKLAAGASAFDTRSEAEKQAPQRISAIEQGAQMLTDLVLSRTRTLAFTRSRRGAELVSQRAQRYLDETEAGLAHRVAAYRSGYMPEERRELEHRLRTGELLGLASTSALELGIDISGLDAVLVAGWPGTRASFIQRIGRAGRGGQDALAVLIAGDDPLDTYLVHHPQAIFGQSVEATVFDPTNPYVLSPHLCAAAAESPLRAEELSLFGEHTEVLLNRLVQQNYLRRRADGWYWTHAESATNLVDLRATGGGPYQLIDAEDGSLIGTMDSAQAMTQGHPGAIYIHQNAQYLVESLDEAARVILLSRVYPDYYTRAIEATEVKILQEKAGVRYGFDGAQPGAAGLTMHRGRVQVTDQVMGFQRFSVYGSEYLGDEPMEMPPSILMTEAIWFTFEPSYLFAAGVAEPDAPGTLHAAEHAAIGLLPLIATCDRWDLGGLSTLYHADTDRPTIFVYDAAPGGAGFTQRGFEAVRTWLGATLDAIDSCGCESGCPSCVQSPKCGNRNEPLSKAGAQNLLRAMLHSLDEAG